MANRAIHDPDHVLHGRLVGQQDAHIRRLRSRRPFVLAAWKLLGSLSKLDIPVKLWMKHKWNADYLESASRVRAFISTVSSRPIGMILPRTSWGRLNRLWTGVDVFNRPCTNGVSLHHQISNVAPLCKLQIRLYFLVSYITYQEEHEV